MNKEGSLKPIKPFKQRYFAAKELQFSIALLIVIALLGGMFLQSVSTALISHYGYNTPALGIFLIVGYALIVIILAVVFTHRLVGPFKRLEYEMKHIAAGELSKRLSVRAQDDLHVKNFIIYTNAFLQNFEEMSKEYNNLNAMVAGKMREIGEELSKERYDCNKIKEELSSLQKQLREFRERW